MPAGGWNRSYRVLFGDISALTSSSCAPHSEHRFTAPSSKEGCRKPVLGVCLHSSPPPPPPPHSPHPTPASPPPPSPIATAGGLLQSFSYDMASRVTPDDLATWKLTDQCDTAGSPDKLITIECDLYCTLPAWQFGGVDYVKWLLCNEWKAAGALVGQWAAP